MHPNLKDAIIGCLLGTAVGDATGLGVEGLSKQRQQKLYPNIQQPQLIFGRGMISDDTEHTCLVAQALITSAGEVPAFEKELASQLRLWLLGLPAGTGKATLQAGLKLWFGAGPERSGVFSAGNGPAMRSAIIGVCYGHDTQRMSELIRVSSRITHTDPKAEYGALTVALAAHMASNRDIVSPQSYINELQKLLDGRADELGDLMQKAVASAAVGQTTEAFAAELGLSRGVSGYIYHTVPVALYAWFKHQRDLPAAVLDLVHCGGDTDSTAAIAGGIIGASVGKPGIPSEWLASLWEWPRSVQWMEKLGERLAEVCLHGSAQPTLPLSLPAVSLRNLCFLAIVLSKAYRRLLPPY